MMHNPDSGFQKAVSCVRTCIYVSSRVQTGFSKNQLYHTFHSFDLPTYITATVRFLLKILKYGE